MNLSQEIKMVPLRSVGDPIIQITKKQHRIFQRKPISDCGSTLPLV